MGQFSSELSDTRKRGRPGTKRSYTHTPKFKSTDSDIEELHNLKGSRKMLWLNLHREDVLAYLELHGDTDTRRHYGLTTPYVLGELKKRWYVETRNKKLSEVGHLRVEVSILAADNSDLRKDIRELKEQYNLFRESVSDQLTKKFFIPLMRAAIHLEPQLEAPEEPPDPLNVQFLMEHTNKK